MSKGSQSASSSVTSTEPEQVFHIAKGHCKFFDPYKGYGYIALEKDDINHKHGDIFFYHTAIFMTGYRALGDTEKVSVQYFLNDMNKFEAKKITAVDGVSQCAGLGLKKPKKLDRCYKCFDQGHHARECTLKLATKRCYICKQEGHVKSACPVRTQKKEDTAKRQKIESEPVISSIPTEVNDEFSSNQLSIVSSIALPSSSEIDEHEQSDNTTEDQHINMNL